VHQLACTNSGIRSEFGGKKSRLCDARTKSYVPLVAGAGWSCNNLPIKGTRQGKHMDLLSSVDEAAHHASDSDGRDVPQQWGDSDSDSDSDSEQHMAAGQAWVTHTLGQFG
jgi:hypothetical protein